MNKIKKTSLWSVAKSGAIIAVLGMFPVLNTATVNAAQVSNRKIEMSSSAGAATGVSYTFTSDAVPTSATIVKSVGVEFCTDLSGSCTTPTGMVTTSSTLAAQPSGLGDAGWTVDNSSAGELRITNSGNASTPSGSVSVQWNGVTNPTAVNTTFYAIVTTYSDAAWTTAVDAGSVALSTSQSINVALTVDETLTFCAGTSITGENCATIAGDTVDLGTGSTTSAKTGTSVMAASTNGSFGYSIKVNGNTLTSGANTITALASATASSAGTSQFGMNLVANTSPATFGANVSGSGSGAADNNYDDTGLYRFVDNDVVASTTSATDANAYTVAYIANIAGSTPAGIYSTVLTYTATANF